MPKNPDRSTMRKRSAGPRLPGTAYATRDSQVAPQMRVTSVRPSLDHRIWLNAWTRGLPSSVQVELASVARSVTTTWAGTVAPVRGTHTPPARSPPPASARRVPSGLIAKDTARATIAEVPRLMSARTTSPHSVPAFFVFATDRYQSHR
jgi:hypothetical protein